MQRSTKFLAALLAGMGVWATGSAVQGGVIPLPPPGPVRVAKADAVIVGKVESLEAKDLMIDNATYRIAVVKIEQGLKGTKDAKTLRIGFVPIPKPMENGKGPFVVRTGGRPVQLEAGQEGLFILKKHAKEDFYTIGGMIGYYISKEKNKDFDKEIESVKVIVKVADKPQAALKEKDAQERLVAAALLIEQYRSWRGPAGKLEPIDAEESKQIMQVLADGDWQTAGTFNSLRPTSMQLFQRLGITVMDGFVPAAPGGNSQAAAQAWVRDHVQTYRIKRFVAGDAK